MANELAVTGSFTFTKNGIGQFARAVTALNVSVNGNGGIYEPGFAIATTDTTLQLGGLVAPFGWAWFHNLDAVNTINIKNATGGTILFSLLPGELAFFRFGSGIVAPVAIATAGAPLLEYCILPP